MERKVPSVPEDNIKQTQKSLTDLTLQTSERQMTKDHMMDHEADHTIHASTTTGKRTTKPQTRRDKERLETNTLERPARTPHVKDQCTGPIDHKEGQR